MGQPSTPPARDSQLGNKGSAKTESSNTPVALGGHSVHRAQSAAYVSRRIGEMTRNGDLMAEKLIAIIEADAPTAAAKQVQIAAIQVLYDRFIGRPAQQVEHTLGQTPGVEMAAKLRQLTTEELRVAALLDTPGKPNPTSKPVIDATGEYRPEESDDTPIEE